MVMKRYLLPFVFALLPLFSVAQNNLCSDPSPFCTGNQYTFPMNYTGTGAGTGPQAQVGPNYGCLFTQPNPVWYYMQIDQSGNLIFDITSLQGVDVDFICYGPFATLNGVCPDSLTAGNTVDCSYSTAATETCNIPNGQVGEYYLILITNYANVYSVVTFSQTGGTGATDCDILAPPVSNNGPLCVGDTLELYSQNVPNAIYNWSGPASFSSNLQNPVIPNAGLPNAGTYTLVVTDTTSGSSDTTSTTVIINPLPFGTITNPAVCGNQPVIFNLNSSGSDTISTYFWNFGTGNPGDTSNLASPPFTFPGAGTYNVSVTITSDEGCVAVVDTPFVVYPKPVADYITEPLCFQDVIFTSTSTQEPSLATWTWTFNDTTYLQGDTSLAILHHFDTAGVYPITLVVVDTNGCTDTVVYDITVYQSVGVPDMPNVLNTSSQVGNEKYDFQVFAPLFVQCYDYTFTIYNRWGFKVFETTSDADNPDINCTSCFKGYSTTGSLLTPGVYYFVLKGMPDFQKKGTITIVD